MNHRSHTQTEEPRIGVISRPEMLQATAATHRLELMIGIMIRIETQCVIPATHSLESQQQVL